MEFFFNLELRRLQGWLPKSQRTMDSLSLSLSLQWGLLCRGLFRGRKQIHNNMLKIPKEINLTRIILIEIDIIFNKQTDKMFMFKKTCFNITIDNH